MPSRSGPARPRVSRVLERGLAERAVALEIAALIEAGRRSGHGPVLGLATGRSPVGVYRELVRLHRQQGLDWSTVVTFNLDEYLGLAREDARSFRAFMQRQLFEHVNVRPENVHIPAGEVARAASAEHCAAYEEAIRATGGIDLQLLGLGRNGHVGFNEPGSAPDSPTRVVELQRVTREDAAEAFGGLEHVPRLALTMGVATIRAAARLRVLAFGSAKARAVRALVEGPVTPALPASLLRDHVDLQLWIDDAAAQGLAVAPPTVE